MQITPFCYAHPDPSATSLCPPDLPLPYIYSRPQSPPSQRRIIKALLTPTAACAQIMIFSTCSRDRVRLGFLHFFSASCPKSPTLLCSSDRDLRGAGANHHHLSAHRAPKSQWSFRISLLSLLPHPSPRLPDRTLHHLFVRVPFAPEIPIIVIIIRAHWRLLFLLPTVVVCPGVLNDTAQPPSPALEPL